jgi:Holliday junction DNA helicase RuvA
MIASVRGPVLEVRLEHAVIEVGGVGLAVQVTPSTAGQLRVGEEARLATTFVVREESMTLYGFLDTDERGVFETIQTVSGIGPRTALAMLAVLSPDELRAAVAREDLKALMAVPGIGRKGAQRIVLERLDDLGPLVCGTGLADKLGTPPGAADQRTQVVEALEGLGWPVRAAEEAVEAVVAARVTAQGDDASVVSAADVSDVLRAALRELGGRRA